MGVVILSLCWRAMLADCAACISKMLTERGLSTFAGRSLIFMLRGVFTPLGQGVVDFSQLLNLARKHGFDGWVVVEQDVLAGGGNGTSPLTNAVAGRRFLREIGV